MNFKKFITHVPSEYQELTFISNSRTQYIDTGLKGSDLADCELEIVMRNDTITTTAYNFNGTYLSGSAAQFGLVATSNSECRSSINFGFADAISTTGLSVSEFHTLYATNGLQKVDNTVVGTLNFGTLNNGSFLLFARTDTSLTSGINICPAMSLKSFTVKRNNQYIRNMIPAMRKSDSQVGLYDLANDVFYTNQGTGDFTGGTVVEPTWHDSHYIRGTATDTLTLPQTIYGDGTNATVTLKGNMQQTGTPTPTTPIQPQECGERTAQLISSVAFPSNYLRFWVENIKSIVATEDTFTFSFTSDVSMAGNSLYLSYTGGSRIVATVGGGTGNLKTTFTLTSADIANILSSSDTYFQVYKSGADFSNCTNIMLNTGETALPYEPYGFKIPILSNSTTTNVYLGEVQTTRQIKKLVLTGEEDWKYSTSSQTHWLQNIPNDYDNTLAAQITTVCTHYKCIRNDTGTTGMANGDLRLYARATSPAAYEMYIKDDTYTSTVDFKSYLQQQYAAGTPVTVWYVLSSATTGIVNEPLCKIGDYADTLSTSIPTTDGANVIDVGTTLKPSEVSANYHGWHTVASAHERESGQWD